MRNKVTREESWVQTTEAQKLLEKRRYNLYLIMGDGRPLENKTDKLMALSRS